MLGIGLSLTVRNTLMLQCTVCHVHIDSNNAKVGLVDMIIKQNIVDFKYRICPKCFNVLDEADYKDRNLRRRWTRSFKKLEQKIGQAVLAEKIEEIPINDILLYATVTSNKNLFNSWKTATNFNGFLVIRF